MKPRKSESGSRRRFFKTLAAGSAGTILIPEMVIAGQSSGLHSKEKPGTNIKDLEKFPIKQKHFLSSPDGF